MSLKKILIKTFLILALGCFWSSSAFADTTYKYFDDANYKCYLDIQAACGARLSKESASYATMTPPRTVSLLSCSEIYPQYKVRVSYANPTTGVISSTDSAVTAIVNTKYKTCPAGETFKLEGCTATCVPDPCASLKDQEFSGASACGSFACNTGTLQNGTCDGKVVLSGASSTVTDTNKCIGTLVSNDLTKAYYKKEDNGKSSGTAYCSATYKYIGASDTSEPTPLDLSLLSLYQAVPLPDDGVCPPSKPLQTTINGIDACIDNQLPDDDNCPVDGEKQNSNGVCVGPDDPTYPKDGEDPNKDPNEDKPNTCPKGQIKNNSGVCVPYGDATNCPVGQVRSNLGTCITDPKANSCPSGQIKNLAGACVPNPKGTGCADGSTPNANGVCANGVGACPVGQTRNASGVCVTTSPSSGCKDGSTPNASGICSDGSGACPVGKIRNASGVCVSDPDDPDSSKSASLASDCQTAPECDGDPIQCAMYHHQWKSNCEAIRAPDENEKAQIRGAIEDTNSQIDGRENEYKDSINAIIADSGLLNNPVPTTAQCIPDKTINIMGGVSVTVPYSLLCPYFSLLRSMLIMVAYLFAARIIYAELTGGGIRV